MVIVASSSYTLTSVSDGSTPVVHWAWSNSADGVTDFSTTTSTSRRFIGSYTDYITTNSTDPTKYKWQDMAGNAVIGIRNYIIGSDVTITTGSKDFTISSDFATTINAQRQITLSLTVNGSNMSDTITAGLWLTLNLTDSTSTTVALVATTPKNYDPRINLTWKLPDGKYVSSMGRCWMEFPGTVPSYAKLQRPKIEFGNLPTGWVAASEDNTAAISDAVNGVKVGGRNLVSNYGDTLTISHSDVGTSKWSISTIIDSQSMSGKTMVATCTTAGNAGFNKLLYDLNNTNWSGKKMVFSYSIKASRSASMSLGAEIFSGGSIAFSVTTSWQKFIHAGTVAFVNYKNFVWYARGTETWSVGDVIYIRDIQLEEGTIATTPHPSQEDSDALSNSKADQGQTTADINTLKQQHDLVLNDLKARAMLTDLTDLQVIYAASLKLTQDKLTQANKDLTDLNARHDETVHNLNAMSERWNFLDSYMKVGNEGLTISSTDGTTSLLLADEGAYFSSGGVTQTLIDADMLKVDHIVASSSVQIGKVQLKQHETNPNMLVMRYVG